MHNNLKKRNKKKGFTLIELIIVIAILAILAAVAVPQFGKVRENANKSTDISNAKTIANAISTLLAEDKIVLPSSTDTVVILDGKEDDDTLESAVSSKKVEEVIVDYLQSTPTPKLSAHRSDYFKATVSKEGKITITLNTTQVYPEPDAASATNNIYYKK